VHSLEGKLFLLAKDHAAASRSFTQALRIDPTMIDAAVGLVNADLAGGNVDTAVKRVEFVLSRYPSDPSILVLAARVFSAGRDAKRAENLLRRAIQIAPGATSTYGMLGDLYMGEGRFEDALRQYLEVEKREPRSATIQTMIGMIHQALKRPDEARRRYETALEIEPNAPTANNNLAWLLADRGEDLDRATRLAQRAIELARDNAEFHDTLGWVYFKKQLPLLAIEPLERAVQGSPNNPQFHYHLGLAHSAAGNPQKARAALQRALSLGNNFDGALDARRMLATLQGGVS
jgi:tetratricopeptide (TPR) repeat protein